MTITISNRIRRADVVPDTPARALKGRLRRWPTVAGIGMAGFIALDLSSGADLAAVLAASGVVYLGAAALKNPAKTWPVFWGTFAIMTVTSVLDTRLDPTWVLLGLAGVLLGYGLLSGAVRPTGGLPLQALAMAGFGTVAAVTMLVSGDLGAYLVAAGLLGHAMWDVYHHRTNRVVVRSLAEFCFVLDTLLAVAVVIVAVRG
jgi:hypothetical protein